MNSTEIMQILSQIDSENLIEIFFQPHFEIGYYFKNKIIYKFKDELTFKKNIFNICEDLYYTKPKNEKIQSIRVRKYESGDYSDLINIIIALKSEDVKYKENIIVATYRLNSNIRKIELEVEKTFQVKKAFQLKKNTTKFFVEDIIVKNGIFDKNFLTISFDKIYYIKPCQGFKLSKDYIFPANNIIEIEWTEHTAKQSIIINKILNDYAKKRKLYLVKKGDRKAFDILKNLTKTWKE